VSLGVRRRTALLIGGFALLLYAGTLPNGFCHDDLSVVLRNVHVRAPALSLPDIFASSYLAGTGRPDAHYRPVTILSFALVDRIASGSPLWQHLASALINSGVVVLLFLATRRLFGEAVGVVAALLFAAHPAHTEAVAYVTGRSEVLALGFGLAAGLAHLARRPVLGGLLLLPALLAKETALSYPVLLAAAILVFDRGHRAHAAAPIAALAVYVLARLVVVGVPAAPPVSAATFVTNPLALLPFRERLLPALALQGRYLLTLLLPATLAIDYSYAAIDPARAAPVWQPGLALLAAAGALLLAARDLRLGAVAVAGLLTFAPLNNLVVPIGTVFADRLLYTPSAFFAVLAAAIVRLGGRRWRAVGAAVVVLLSARTVIRTLDWKDDYTIFKAAYAAGSHDSVIVLHNYAYNLYTDPRRTDLELAERLLARAHALRWDFGAPLLTIASIQMKRGRIDEAERTVDECLRLYPGDFRSHRLKAELLHRHRGRPGDALPHIRRSLELNASQPELRAWLAGAR
jgi:tetratricopeptide (TPR) repeat protein